MSKLSAKYPQNGRNNREARRNDGAYRAAYSPEQLSRLERRINAASGRRVKAAIQRYMRNDRSTKLADMLQRLDDRERCEAADEFMLQCAR